MKMCTQEVTQIQELNDQRRTDLERRQAAEVRSLHKNLKTETKTRTLQFKKSQRISANVALSPEQELERLKQVCIGRADTENRNVNGIIYLQTLHKFDESSLIAFVHHSLFNSVELNI